MVISWLEPEVGELLTVKNRLTSLGHTDDEGYYALWPNLRVEHPIGHLPTGTICVVLERLVYDDLGDALIKVLTPLGVGWVMTKAFR